VKLFGTIVTVSACLFSGPEGPMILIGSSVASAFTRGLKVVSCFRGKFVIGTNLMSRLLLRLPQRTQTLPHSCLYCAQLYACPQLPRRFHNDRDRRDFISAGAAGKLPPLMFTGAFAS
jgi:hypothetical protein